MVDYLDTLILLLLLVLYCHCTSTWIPDNNFMWVSYWKNYLNFTFGSIFVVSPQRHIMAIPNSGKMPLRLETIISYLPEFIASPFSGLHIYQMLEFLKWQYDMCQDVYFHQWCNIGITILNILGWFLLFPSWTSFQFYTSWFPDPVLKVVRNAILSDKTFQ